jgi:hypothetical protein
VEGEKFDFENLEVRKPKKQEFSTNFTGASHKIGDLLTKTNMKNYFSEENPEHQCFQKETLHQKLLRGSQKKVEYLSRDT